MHPVVRDFCERRPRLYGLLAMIMAVGVAQLGRIVPEPVFAIYLFVFSSMFVVTSAAYLAVARNPLAGDEMPGTGGLRKLRWSRAGMGKRGGARVIYYYYNETAPVYLFMAYAKAAQENPSPAAVAILAKLAAAAKAGIKARQKEK
jgi:hypothetical protein